MNKIHNAFENKKAFIGFLTAGDPTFEDSFNNIMAMVKGGADLIEIGIPFSDPIAEGPVIQDANIRALSHGMTTDRAFELAEKVRQNTDIPICFMTYLNPVFKYGYDRFFERCQKIGVDGLICPDMPYEEKHEAADVAQKYGVSIISLIAPTSEDRIKMIASEAEGFLPPPLTSSTLYKPPGSPSSAPVSPGTPSAQRRRGPALPARCRSPRHRARGSASACSARSPLYFTSLSAAS